MRDAHKTSFSRVSQIDPRRYETLRKKNEFRKGEINYLIIYGTLSSEICFVYAVKLEMVCEFKLENIITGYNR